MIAHNFWMTYIVCIWKELRELAFCSSRNFPVRCINYYLCWCNYRNLELKYANSVDKEHRVCLMLSASYKLICINNNNNNSNNNDHCLFIGKYGVIFVPFKFLSVDSCILILMSIISLSVAFFIYCVCCKCQYVLCIVTLL